MTVKLKANESVFALYNDATDEYVYLGGGNGIFGFKPYPKPTGMAPTAEKLQKKHENLLTRLLEMVDHDADLTDEKLKELFDNMQNHLKSGFHGFEGFARLRRHTAKAEKERWSKELEIAKSFIIVEISVKKV